MWSALDFARAADVAAAVPATSAKAAVIILVAAAAAAGLRRASASVRHLVWATALAATLALPVLAAALPGWDVPADTARAAAVRAVVAIRSTVAAVATPSPATPRRAPVSPTTESADAGVHRANGTVAREALPLPGDAARSRPDETLPTLDAGAERVERPLLPAGRGIDWRRVLAVAWLVGVVLALVPVLAGQLRVRALVRRARPASGPVWDAPLDAAVVALGLRRGVRLLEADGHTMPMTAGLLAPVVILPAGAADWPGARRRDVLLHELAHVARYDCLWQLIARLACAVHWFNPLVWRAARRLQAERELACDDAVVAAGVAGSEYARHLVEVALTLRPALPASAALAMARRSQLEGRVLAILDARADRRAVSRGAAAAAAVGALTLALPLAAMRPAGPQAPAPAWGDDVALIADDRRGVRGDLSVPDDQLVWEDGSSPDEGRPAGRARAAPIDVAPLDRLAPAGRLATALPDSGGACWDRPGAGGSSSHISEDDGSRRRWSVRVGRAACHLDMEADGKIEFDAALTDVKSLEPGGTFELETRDAGVERRIEIRADRAGALTRRYWLDGREVPFDAPGRAWLAATLLSVERRSAFAAEARVPQLLAAGGTAGTLDEIDRLGSDYARKRYYAVLLGQRSLSDPDLVRAIRGAGKAISSDYELAETLLAAARNGVKDPAVQTAYVEAVGSIESDFEQRRALTPLLDQPDLDAAVVPALLRAASMIESDYELAELLIDVSPHMVVDARTRRPFFDAVNSLESDYEQRRVLATVIGRPRLDRETTGEILRAATSLQSDYELAELLIGLARAQGVDTALAPAYFAAARTIDSDYEQSRVLRTMLAGGVTRPMLLALLTAAQGIASDYELAELLIAAARRYPPAADDELRSAFLRAAEGLDSEYEYGRVAAVLRTKRG